MNALENWFCSTAFWRRATQQDLLPWMISGASLGDHVLELGSGPGAATEELRRRALRVVSLEYSHGFAANLAARPLRGNGCVLQGDAAALPFAHKSFSSAIAVLVITTTLRSSEQQERAFPGCLPRVAPRWNFLRGRNSGRVATAGRALAQHLRRHSSQDNFLIISPLRDFRRLTSRLISGPAFSAFAAFSQRTLSLTLSNSFFVRARLHTLR